MRRTVPGNLLLYSQNLSLTNPSHPSRFSTSSRLRFFSSGNSSSIKNPKPHPGSTTTQRQKEDVSMDEQDVSNEELKKQIEKYFQGDEEAIPSIFEAILKRKLAGKHEEADEELMEEIRRRPLDGVEDKEFESESEER